MRRLSTQRLLATAAALCCAFGCATTERPVYHYTKKKDGRVEVTPYVHRGIYPSETDYYTGYGSGLRRGIYGGYYGGYYGYHGGYRRRYYHDHDHYDDHRHSDKKRSSSSSSSRSRSSSGSSRSSSSKKSSGKSEPLLRDRGRNPSSKSESRPARGRRLESGDSDKKSGRRR